jgi:DinB family protein
MGASGSAVKWASLTLQEIWKENDAIRQALVTEVRGLSEAQLVFQPTPGKWSIGEILDHLSLAERSIARVASRVLQQAAGRGLIGEPGSMEPPPYQIDRGTFDAPAAAPESVLPSLGRPLERLLASLEESRERLLEVSSRADGRVVGNVTVRHFQLGELHFYQWLLLEGAHESKHLAQIRQIKLQSKFPKV